MDREIVRWSAVALALLGLCTVAAGQEEQQEAKSAIVRRIWDELAIQATSSNERERACRFLEALREQLGLDEATALTEIDDLTVELQEQGHYAEAQALCEEVLVARRRLQGADHPQTLNTMNNLAQSLQAQGDLPGARALQEEVLPSLRRLLGDEHPKTLTAIMNLAGTLQIQGHLPDAGLLFEEVLATRRRVLGNENPKTLLAMNNLAGNLHWRGDLSGARALFEEMLEILRWVRGADHPQTLVAINNVAQTLLAQGELTKARALFEEAVEGLSRVQGTDHPQTLVTMHNVAQTLLAQGELSQARTLFEELIPRFRRVLGANHPETLNAMNSFGHILSRQGELAEARALFEDLMPSLRRVLGPDHRLTLAAMVNLAWTHQVHGDFAAARALGEEVMAIQRRVLGANHLDTLGATNNLASILHLQGDLTGARALLEDLLPILHKVLGAEHGTTLNAMENLAATLQEQGHLSAAQALLEDNLATRHRVLRANHPDTLAAMGNLAITLTKVGDLSEARALFEQVLAARQLVLGAEHPNTLSAISNLAVILYHQKDVEGARLLNEKIVEIRQSLFGPRHEPNTTEEATTFHWLGRIYRDRGELEKAFSFFQQALDALECQTARAGGTEESKSVFRTQFNEYYHDAVVALLSLKRKSDALYTLERYRAQSFLRLLSERDPIYFEIPPELRSKRRQFARRYDRALQQLRQPRREGETETISDLIKKQRELRREREMLDAEIYRTSDRLATIENPEFLTVDKIRQALDPGTLMLSYSVGTQRVDLFALTTDGDLTVHELPFDGERIRKQVERFNEQVHGETWDHVSVSRIEMGKWLFQNLIGPVVNRAEESDRLLIVPDGPLHQLPFASLIRTTGVTRDSERGWQYLIEWKPIHSVLSATVYAELQDTRRRNETKTDQMPLHLVAFGDPVYFGGGPEHDRSTANARLATIMDLDFFDGLKSLPHSRREVTEIGQLYPEQVVKIHVDKEATEERAKAIGRNARIVHFAVHGVPTTFSPLDSFLALSVPADPGEGRDNGLLQAWEIFERIRLDADLVVLSACESALGPERGGEGLISLSRAFQYAGARTVAATLWSVNDISTSELMIRFYRNLRDGMPKDEALRAAQMEFIRRPIEVVNEAGAIELKDYRGPYYWAAFQLIGDWQ